MPVLLPYPFAGPFDYRVPPGMQPKPGDVVLVPLNNREKAGIVWDTPPDEGVPAHKLKSVIAILDTPPMGESLRRFIDWIAAYTLSPPGDVMAMALRVVSATDRPVVHYRRTAAPPSVRLTPARQRVLDVLEKKPGVPIPINRHNQRVYVHHLHAFVFDEVSNRSGQRQHPFLSLPSIVESFPVR